MDVVVPVRQKGELTRASKLITTGSTVPKVPRFANVSIEKTLWFNRLRLLGTFAVGQGLTQGIGIITGFLLLRWLSVEDYAQFSLAFGFQCTLALLCDLGISTSIVNLVGARGDEPAVIGQYVTAARWLRNRLFITLLPIGAVAFHWFADRHGWSLREQITLYGLTALSLFLQTTTAWYAAPLIIHKRLTASYGAGLASAAGRLGATGFLQFAGFLNASGTYLVNTVALMLNAALVRRASRSLLVEETVENPAIRREMITYLVPIIPGMIFFAFQGQLTIFLISIFGTTESVAEVGALGRLAQIFTALTALSGAVICPYFARLPTEKVPRRYALTIAGAIAAACALTLFAHAWGDPVQWLLGPRYRDMHSESVGMIAASSISFVAALMHGVALARKWVRWWVSIAGIVVIVCVQVAMMLLLDLSTTSSVVWFSVGTAFAMVIAQAITALYARWNFNAEGE